MLLQIPLSVFSFLEHGSSPTNQKSKFEHADKINQSFCKEKGADSMNQPPNTLFYLSSKKLMRVYLLKFSSFI